MFLILPFDLLNKLITRTHLSTYLNLHISTIKTRLPFFSPPGETPFLLPSRIFFEQKNFTPTHILEISTQNIFIRLFRSWKKTESTEWKMKNECKKSIDRFLMILRFKKWKVQFNGRTYYLELKMWENNEKNWRKEKYVDKLKLMWRKKRGSFLCFCSKSVLVYWHRVVWISCSKYMQYIPQY